MAHFYLSYSRENSDFVDIVEADLTERGHPAWRDVSNIKDGNDWNEAIETALRDAYAVVVVLSEKALSSDWVDRELSFAHRKGTPIVTVQLEECLVPNECDRKRLIDLTKLREAKEFEQQQHMYRQGLTALITALDDTYPLRLHVAALGDPDDTAREHGARSLGELGDLGASEALIGALADPDGDVRFAAAEALGKLECEAALKSLMRTLEDGNPDVCAAAAIALGQLGQTEPIGPLIKLLDHVDRFVRAGAAQALGTLGAAEAATPLVHIMRNDPISNVRAAAEVALCAIGGPVAARALVRAGVDCEAIATADAADAAPT